MELIKTIELANRQRLEIYDASKKIAGDRWQVTLKARMVISINDLLSGNSAAEPPITDIQPVLGDTILYEIKKQRNFIGETEKPDVFKQLLDTLTEHSVPYLSHPEFPKRFAMKKYYESRNRIRR